MKIKIIRSLKMITIGIGFSPILLANHAALLNISTGSNPLSITYQIIHKNKGEATVLGELKTIRLQKDTVINFPIHGYQMAAFVPVSIEGHTLPTQANKFGHPKQCSLATDRSHPDGLITIKLVKRPNGHSSLFCTIQGGIFQ